MIRTMIVDDSALVRTLMQGILKSDGRFEVVALADNGERAIRRNAELTPDLILMDVRMPIMDGIEATRKITGDYPVTIVAFTSEDDAETGYRCLEAGAVDIIRKPSQSEMEGNGMHFFCDRLAQIVMSMSMSMSRENTDDAEDDETIEIPGENAVTEIKEQSSVKNNSEIFPPMPGIYKMIVMGSSTGGPSALQEIIKSMGPDFPLPVAITQHIDSGFDSQLAHWLSTNTGCTVKLAEDGEKAVRGVFYLSPAQKHLVVREDPAKIAPCIFSLDDEPPLHFLKPAVDKLFSSASDVFGKNLIAVLLTGMGRDGELGCASVKEKGGYTICEDESSCVVFGMPKAAIEGGHAVSVRPLQEIVPHIRKLIGM